MGQRMECAATFTRLGHAHPCAGHTWGVDIRPEDLRIDVIRHVGDGTCAVRITYIPTGTTAYADNTDDFTTPAIEMQA